MMRLIMALAVSAILSCTVASTAHAQACAADVRTQMLNNAHIQAERKMVIANTLIRKPDSVLEYSCFDQRAAMEAGALGARFPDSLDWMARVVNTTTLEGPSMTTYSSYLSALQDHLDNSINTMVMGAMSSYINSNFSHTLLGGASGIGNVYESSVIMAGGFCDIMYLAQEASRCRNFADDAPLMSLSWWAGNDPRAMPSTCPSTHDITTALVDQANNAGFAHTSFDHVTTYLGYILEGGSASACSASPPIPTGRMVVYQRFEEDLAGNPVSAENYSYEDKVCANPDCYFDHNNNANGNDDRCIR